MKNNNRNIRIIAENNGNRDGFNIYLDFSGQREFVMYHRHNGLLYALLRDKPRLDELLRWRGGRGRLNTRFFRENDLYAAKKLEPAVLHLLDVIEDHMIWREEDGFAA